MASTADDTAASTSLKASDRIRNASAPSPSAQLAGKDPSAVARVRRRSSDDRLYGVGTG